LVWIKSLEPKNYNMIYSLNIFSNYLIYILDTINNIDIC